VHCLKNTTGSAIPGRSLGKTQDYLTLLAAGYFLLTVVGGGAMFAGEVFIEQVLRDVAGIGLDKPGLGRPGELE
jgi:hypothetical protein